MPMGDKRDCYRVGLKSLTKKPVLHYYACLSTRRLDDFLPHLKNMDRC